MQKTSKFEQLELLRWFWTTSLKRPGYMFHGSASPRDRKYMSGLVHGCISESEVPACGHHTCTASRNLIECVAIPLQLAFDAQAGPQAGIRSFRDSKAKVADLETRLHQSHLGS